MIKRASCNLESDVQGKPNETSLLKGERFKDFYAPFGTEMDWQLFHEMAEDQLEPFKEFISELNLVVAKLIQFAATAIDCWVRDHEGMTHVTELPSDRS